jgi:hypothetical protein
MMASYRRQFRHVEFNIYVGEVGADRYDCTAYEASSTEPYEEILTARSEVEALNAMTAVLETLFGPALQS